MSQDASEIFYQEPKGIKHMTPDTSEILYLIKENTRHEHGFNKGDVSLHRIGSEICYLIRDGAFDRIPELNDQITPEIRNELKNIVESLGENPYRHHSDHTYRKIARAVLAQSDSES